MTTSKGSELFQRIADIYSAGKKSTSSGPDSAQELCAMAQLQLGQNYDPRKIEAVSTIQENLQTRQKEMAELLQAHRIAPEQYFDQLCAIQLEAAHQTEAILGRADFEKLFGVSADETPNLADRETFLAQYR